MSRVPNGSAFTCLSRRRGAGPGGRSPGQRAVAPPGVVLAGQRERETLPGRLPAGLAIPCAVAVRDLDADSAALWLEQVPARRVSWDAGRHARAAYLLGRLAASRAVAPLATAVHGARTPRVYAGAWLAHIVLPALTGNDIWSHPLIRDAFDARLRGRLLTAADALPALLDELDDAPAATAHGDACTANLLHAGDRDALVMVDLGFCGQAVAIRKTLPAA